MRKFQRVKKRKAKFKKKKKINPLPPEKISNKKNGIEDC